MNDDFYIGYAGRAPAPLGRFLRLTVVGLVLAAAALAGLLAALQDPFGPGTFEFGQPRRLSGVIRQRPVPLLEVERPGAAERSRWPLVLPGKHGAAALAAEHEGERVTLEGSLIHRLGRTMVEVVPGSVERRAAPPPPAAGGEDLGVHTLSGEIVDSKCYLGVMKPNRDKPHRACAILCIRGGIPPLLVVDTAAGNSDHYLLVDPDGGPVNRRVLPRVAEPVEITGRVTRYGDLMVLAADPAAYRCPAPRGGE